MRGAIRKGDRVRLTFEGWVSVDDGKTILLTSELCPEVGRTPLYLIFGNDNPAAKIELIQSPLAVGDRVRNMKVSGYDSRTGKIEFIVNLRGEDYCIVSGFGDGFGLAPLNNYGRIS